MGKQLYKRFNYLTPIGYIKNSLIYDYDIAKANINVMKAAGVISDQEYDNFLIMDKMNREICIGNMIKKNQDISKIIKDGITEAKKELMISNNIDDDEVVRIANDSMVIKREFPLKYTRFKISEIDHYIEFVNKGMFTTMMNLNGIVLFFINQDGSYNVEVKGINDELLYLHEPILRFICDILSSMERSEKSITLGIFNRFYEDYVNKKLPMTYYREFNAGSCYRIENAHIGTRILDEKYFDKLDISYNIYMLRKLYSYILMT